MNWIYRATPWEKQLLQTVGFGSIQSEKTFESSCEKEAVTKGGVRINIQILRWSQAGELFGGEQSAGSCV